MEIIRTPIMFDNFPNCKIFEKLIIFRISELYKFLEFSEMEIFENFQTGNFFSNWKIENVE